MPPSLVLLVDAACLQNEAGDERGGVVGVHKASLAVLKSLPSGATWSLRFFSSQARLKQRRSSTVSPLYH